MKVQNKFMDKTKLKLRILLRLFSPVEHEIVLLELAHVFQCVKSVVVVGEVVGSAVLRSYFTRV